MPAAAPPSRPEPTTGLHATPVLLALLALWLLATLGLRPLLLPDEGRYAEVARAMWQHDVLVPTLDGLPFFHKPPLFYWLDIAAMQLVGAHEFAGRFGSAVGGWLMGASLFVAMRRWHGVRIARIGLGVLATTPFFFVGAQYANHDMLVGGLITAAVLAFACAVGPRSSAGSTPARVAGAAPRVALRWVLAGWLLCALAMLAKGLIGVVLPALVIGPWLLAQRRWRELLALLHPFGLAVFALVGLPWFIAMQLRYPGFFDYFVVEQHFRRFAQSTFNNVHGAWFFIAVLPLLTLPWAGWLPAAAKRLVGRSRESGGEDHGVAAAWRDPVIGLYAWWVVAIVGFFSIPSSKLVGYALPALAPWCALLGLAVAASGARWRRGVFAAAAIGCVAIVAVAAWKAPQSNRPLALALAAAMAPGDTVVMIDEYFYDVPFYARLSRPVVIAADWADPQIPRRDNWRKEVFDAARFDPLLAATLLRPLSALDRLACGASVVWFIAAPGQAARVEALPGAARVFTGPRSLLWRVPGRACG